MGTATESSTGGIGLMMVSPGELVRVGLRYVFARTGDIAVMAESAGEPVTQGDIDRADVVLLDDLSLHGAHAPALRHALAAPGFPPVLMFTMRHSASVAARLLRQRARGYVAKDSEASVLLDAVRCLAAGGRFIDPALAAANIPLWPDGRQSLSPRELEVLRHLALGHTVAGIARALGLSPGTVSTHRTRIMRKLDLRCSADLVNFAIESSISDACFAPIAPIIPPFPRPPL